MRHLPFLALLLFAASPLWAQQATLSTPEVAAVPTGATSNINGVQLIVLTVQEDRDCACATVVLGLRDAGGTVLKRKTFAIPADPGSPGTEIADFELARNTARTGETGNGPRRQNFRVLGYLVDSGRISGVTLVP